MKQVKVKNIQKINTTQSGTIEVVLAQLIWIDLPMSDYVRQFFTSNHWDKSPILFSPVDQEKDLVPGDKVLFTPRSGPREIVEYVNCRGYGMGVKYSDGSTGAVSYSACARILALPDHLSPKHLQVIAKNKLQDRDKVWIEIEETKTATGLNLDKNKINYEVIKEIKFSPYITLHKYEDSPEELALKELGLEYIEKETDRLQFNSFVKGFKKGKASITSSSLIKEIAYETYKEANTILVHEESVRNQFERWFSKKYPEIK